MNTYTFKLTDNNTPVVITAKNFAEAMAKLRAHIRA